MVKSSISISRIYGNVNNFYGSFTVFTVGRSNMFADILKSLRTRKNISQPQLAKEISVSSGNISDWETGRSKPGYVALSALSRFFEVSADYLLELDNEPVKTGDSLSHYKEEQGLTCDGSPLEEEEADLIAMLRLMSSDQQEEIFDYTYFKYRRFVERKRESIYSTYGKGKAYGKSGPDEEEETPFGTA